MTQPRLLFLIVSFLILISSSASVTNKPTKSQNNKLISISVVDEGYAVTSPFFKLLFNAQGDLIKMKLIGKHYEKDFLPEEKKSLLSDDTSLDKSQGIRFGFLGENASVFKLIESSVLQGDELGIKFLLRDVTPESKSFGLEVEKKYVFRKETYQIDFDLRLNNKSTKTVDLYSNLDVKKSLGLLFGVVTPADYWTSVVFGNKGELDDYGLESSFREVELGDWEYAAIRGTYFVFAAKQRGFEKVFGKSTQLEVPEGSPDPAINQYSLFFPLIADQLKAGEGMRRQVTFYLGEKREDTMAETAFATIFDKYDGMVGGISHAMFFVLSRFYDLTGSYGWAILLLTLVVKLMLLPLALKQTRSMAAMQELQPEMKKLQEKYANDKQTLNQEMMKLYQTHQVNPIAGCLPMLLQFPIFIALFYTVGGSVEMYGESFYFIPDLGYPDPYSILPILFVLSFLISQKKMATADPNQKLMMYIFPVMFFFMMRTLSSGVMLYIVGQNILTNFEQAFVTKRPVTNTASGVEVIKSETTDSQSPTPKKKKKRRKKAVRGQGV